MFTYCISIVKQILKLFPQVKTRKNWKVIILLIIFFLFGYLINIIAILLNVTELLIVMQAFVYVFGALFVMLVVTLSRKTYQNVLDSTIEIEEQKRIEQGLLNAKIAADAANQAKSDFLANMSHELRTPLNSIIGFTEVLCDQIIGPVTSEQAENLHIILIESHRLLDLFNDILDLSKIEAGKIDLSSKSFFIKHLIEELFVLFSKQAASKHITLCQEIAYDPGEIHDDPSKLQQVFSNLLSNALKFTLDGGRIGISTQKVRKNIVFTVWDTGIGIAASDLPNLFQPFRQLESPLTKSHQGSGLGLHLSRKLVELMGGQIWVKSELGKGSQFSFSIPLQEMH